MDTNQPTNPITKENLAEVQLSIQKSLDAMNPLAGHPLFQKKDPDLVSADFGALETRVMAATVKAIGDPDTPGPNRGGDTFPEEEKPATFVVPANTSDADLAEITNRLQKETKLPIEVIRRALPKVAEEAPAILRSHQGWMREERARQEAKLPAQVTKALGIIQAAKRPVKFGFVEQALNEPVFRVLEQEVQRHPNIRTKSHKNKLYYTWKD